MSTLYCHAHHANIDTDFAPCEECVRDLIEELEQAATASDAIRNMMFIAGCSDSRYHSNGRYAEHKARLVPIEARIKAIRNELEELGA
tara:strand:+ start:879 stop:1142 length:264 start_codon:yes stop_codon:yes gene_type:complete